MLKTNQIYERVTVSGEQFIIWCRPAGQFNQRWVYFLTREGCCFPDRESMLVRPTSLKRVREWLRAQRWQRLEVLRAGAIFETQAGVRAVKSEYRYSNDNPQPMCVLLASGEYAHFPEKGDTLVRELFL